MEYLNQHIYTVLQEFIGNDIDIHNLYQVFPLFKKINFSFFDINEIYCDFFWYRKLNIKSFTPIERFNKFTHITHINCSDNDIYHFKKEFFLPTLTYLNCNNCNINIIDLPNNHILKYLDCSYNKIQSCISFSLLKSLKTLKCNNNIIENITLPPSIEYLDCSKNKIGLLQKNLNLLTHLIINGNNIQQLPKMDNITYINCNYNIVITNIHVYPKLKHLYMNSTYLPSFSKIKLFNIPLVHLECSFASIKYLPILPPSLTYLNCSNNLLLDLPQIPNVKYLNCSNNLLLKLPKITKCIKLICKNNGLHTIQKSMTGNKLEYIDCKFNIRLISISLCNPTCIKYLDCSHNTNLIHLPDNMTTIKTLLYYNCKKLIIPQGLNTLLSLMC